MASATKQTDICKLSDGTTMELARVPGVDDATWNEVKAYLESNPEAAKKLQKTAKDPEAVRSWLQTQAIADHYSSKLAGGDTAVQEQLKSLESDPELASMFEDIKKNGLEAIIKYQKDEELMLKISQKMGGLPSEMQAALKKIEESPLTFHEACKMGNLKAVQECIEKKQSLDTQDSKGITALGYAVGANRIAVVKQLLDARANPHSVDASGNSAMHYAAGYGRKELLEYLLKIGVNVNQSNAKGQTPLSVATINKHTPTIEILKAAGARE